MYRCMTDVPFERAVDLFQAYTAGNNNWIKLVEWEEWSDEFHEQSKPIGFWKRIGYGLVGIYVLIDLYFRWPMFLGIIVLFAISYYCSIRFKHKFSAA